jgi:hypothetical protein
VACLWLLAASALGAAAVQLASRAGRAAPLIRSAPVVLALALWLLTPSAAGTAGVSLRALEAWRAVGPRSGLEASLEPRFCPHLERDAIVSSPDPWTLYLVCGNAGWVRPLDLDDPARLARYLAERAPGYLLVEVERAARWSDSPRLERVAAHAGLVLFRVRDADPRSRPWSAPPPLAPGRSGSAWTSQGSLRAGPQRAELVGSAPWSRSLPSCTDRGAPCRSARCPRSQPG